MAELEAADLPDAEALPDRLLGALDKRSGSKARPDMSSDTLDSYLGGLFSGVGGRTAPVYSVGQLGGVDQFTGKLLG